ncbi:MAG: hypothetical protein ABIN48_02660 [Ginsengibacter sp.]
MKTRTKKYFQNLKADSGDKKGSASRAGYDEQNEITIRQPKANPAPSKTEEKMQQKIGKQKSSQVDQHQSEK